MMKIAKAHFDHLPVWIEGNAYLGGAQRFCKEKNYLMDEKTEVYVNVREEGEKVYLDTNLADARKRAQDELYYIQRDKRKDSVEIRQYEADIEDDNCTCFDYNLIPIN